MTLASAAGACSGFARWSYALHDGAASPGQPQYRPQFFSPAEYGTLEVLVELILPAMPGSANSTQPGAKEAGVAEFIDFMAYSDASLQAPFREGLAWLDHTSGSVFASLPAAQQNALLERLAYKAKHRAEDASGQAFFRLLRKYTATGFYTTRIGLESLDYPGLKFYTTSPECTHPGNPEHVGL